MNKLSKLEADWNASRYRNSDTSVVLKTRRLANIFLMKISLSRRSKQHTKKYSGYSEKKNYGIRIPYYIRWTYNNKIVKPCIFFGILEQLMLKTQTS